ncbi:MULTISPECIES: DinB family protein [Bacillus]|uniref:DinB family protein n=1 Tax=Bacillus TaxID=1386 RepID=UPI001F218F68|nr:DinB family protein [Bacillus glycinifermentans]
MMSIFNEARKETWSEIRELSDDDINKRPEQDEWSIQEVLDHLKKLDLQAARLFRERIRSAPFRTIEAKPVHVSEDRSVKRKAPDSLEPERKTTDLLAIKAELDHARSQLTTVIATLQEEDFERVLPHSVFKELTVRQWIDFIGHHEKRHVKQIQEIKKKLS